MLTLYGIIGMYMYVSLCKINVYYAMRLRIYADYQRVHECMKLKCIIYEHYLIVLCLMFGI